MRLDNPMNFSWIKEGEIGGSAGPGSLSDLEYLKGRGVAALIRLTDTPRVTSSQVSDTGLTELFIPMEDFVAPSWMHVESIMRFIEKVRADGKAVCVSCDVGYGRTGTVLAMYLVATGIPAEDAIKEIRQKRPHSIESKDQEDAVRQYAKNPRRKAL